MYVLVVACVSFSVELIMYMRIINYAHDSEKTLKIPPRALGIEGTWALRLGATDPTTHEALISRLSQGRTPE